MLIEILIICCQCFLSAFPASKLRKKYFTKEFFENNFPELKGQYPLGAYPDSGCGRYSSKLSLPAWVELNSAFRVHQNYVEGLVPIVASLLIAGLFQPKLTVRKRSTQAHERAREKSRHGNYGQVAHTLLCFVVMMRNLCAVIEN